MESVGFMAAPASKANLAPATVLKLDAFRQPGKALKIGTLVPLVGALAQAEGEPKIEQACHVRAQQLLSHLTRSADS